MEANQTLMRIVRVLTHVIDASDPHSRGRSLRISRYAVRVARELGVPESDYGDIELGAMLHDLGRFAILNDVVQTPVFKERMGALGMTVPALADNTPERFDAFMREATARQADFAKLSGHTPTAPQR
jgi:hypothetical protein